MGESILSEKSGGQGCTDSLLVAAPGDPRSRFSCFRLGGSSREGLPNARFNLNLHLDPTTATALVL